MPNELAKRIFNFLEKWANVTRRWGMKISSWRSGINILCLVTTELWTDAEKRIMKINWPWFRALFFSEKCPVIFLPDWMWRQWCWNLWDFEGVTEFLFLWKQTFGLDQPNFPQETESNFSKTKTSGLGLFNWKGSFELDLIWLMNNFPIFYVLANASLGLCHTFALSS